MSRSGTKNLADTALPAAALILGFGTPACSRIRANTTRSIIS